MSYYGDGRVSADFCGLARRKRTADDPSIFHVYCTGAAGNVTAGKYNDGARENRAVLRDRVYAGMVSAWNDTKRRPLGAWTWRTEVVTLAPRAEASFGRVESQRVLADAKETAAKRNNAAFQLAWLDRLSTPIDVGSLDFGEGVSTLHLPGEPFIEYQLTAAKVRPDRTVCVAGYGDGGPGYIPTAAAFHEGGYEPTVALAHPESEGALLKVIAKVLGGNLPEVVK
jgi:hypothetical protein